MGKVVPFPRKAIGQYIRVGSKGYRQLEELTQSGRLEVERAVFDAPLVTHQAEFIRDLGARRCELVLDKKVAELSAEGRFNGVVRQAPWSKKGRPLQPSDFSGSSGREMVRQIARLAISYGFHAVLAPTHLIESSRDPWLRTDRHACDALRRALDVEGAAAVAIDYPLIVPYHVLREPTERAALRNALKDGPFENLWFRVSGFGLDSTGVGVRRYIESLRDFTPENGSLIVDHIAGLAALATLAYGAAGGVAHGIGDHERFDASAWNQPPKSGFAGIPRRVLVNGFDRQITLTQLEAITAAPGGRRFVTCAEPVCCPRGYRDMTENERAHYAFRRRNEIIKLSAVPASRRADHFVRHNLREAERKARAATRLKIADRSVVALLKRDSDRIDRMADVLEALLATEPRRDLVPEARLRLFDPAFRRMQS